MRIREAQNIRILRTRTPTLYCTQGVFFKISINFRGKKKIAETVKPRMRTWRERPGEGWAGGAEPCPRVRGRPGTAPPSPPLGSRQTAAAAGGRALLSPCLKGQFHQMNSLQGVFEVSYQHFLCVCADGLQNFFERVVEVTGNFLRVFFQGHHHRCLVFGKGYWKNFVN